VLVLVIELGFTRFKGEIRVLFDVAEDNGIPVTLTLYHLVRSGGHTSLAVILLFDPSLIEV
jgi:hypothetical protein